jgi:hypothetical protein
MAVHGRKTLVNYFQGGALPTADQFRDLIDSSFNRVDDGIKKSPEDGICIASLSEPNFISFYDQSVFTEPLWRVAYDKDSDALQVRKAGTADPHAVSSLTIARNRVGVLQQAPAAELDVAGVVRARGRAGYPPVANSEAAKDERSGWQPLTEFLRGCHAFEVVAGVGGGEKSGRYALLHAIAMNAFNPAGLWTMLFGRGRPIRTLHASYGRRGDRLQLRWGTDATDPRSYRLEIRSRCPLPPGRQIQAHVTRLWHDPLMAGAGAGEPGQRRPPR